MQSWHQEAVGYSTHHQNPWHTFHGQLWEDVSLAIIPFMAILSLSLYT